MISSRGRAIGRTPFFFNLGIILTLVLTLSCDETTGVGVPGPVPPGCSRLDDYLHVTAIARPPGMSLGAAVHGPDVFTINGAAGIFALDASDPSEVHVVAHLDTLTDARAIASSGPWLFVAGGKDGLAVVDIADASSPRIAKIVRMPGAVVDVRIQNQRAYLANDLLGLVIVDIADRENPALLGVENTPGHAVGVAVSGTLAFVAEEPSGLRVVNIIDPRAPFVIEDIAVPGFVEGIDAGNGFVAMAVGQAGLQLVDVSQPSAPLLAGIVNTPVDAIGVALVEDIAFVADASGGAVIVNVKDIAHPLLAGSLGTASFTHSVSVSDGRLVIADDDAGARVLDVTPPTTAPFDSLAAGGDIRSLSTLGDLVVVADRSFGLHVVDPSTRSIIGEYPMAPAPKDVFVADSMAYVARVSGKIAIVDLHDPSAPVAAGEFGSGQETDHIVTAGNFGYLLDETGWLYEERINPPGNTGLFRDTAVLWASVAVDPHPVLGTILYVADMAGTVLVIPASQMRPIATLPVSAPPQRVVIRHYDGPLGPGTGALAYVAEYGGVEVFDVTDPAAPQPNGRFTCSGNAVDVAFAGAQVVVGEREDGAELFNLLSRDRAEPVGMLVARTMRVAVSNQILVAAGGKSGVLLLNLTPCPP